MLFKDLSIEAMDRVIEEYRDPKSPILLDLDEYLYEFTEDGELIDPPEVLDMFHKEVKMGDVVVFPYSSGNSYVVHCGRVLQVKFLKKDGQPRQEPVVVVKWPENDDLITQGVHGNIFRMRRTKSISVKRAKDRMVNVTKIL